MRKNPYYSGPPSDHFDGLRFFNPGQPSTDRTLGEIWRWRSAGGAARWPQRVPITPALPPARSHALRVTTVGHATTLVQAGGLNFLTDPIWSERASPVSFAGPRRVTAPGVAFSDLPPIDAVLISHNHYDHFDTPTLRRLHAAHHPLFLVPLGNDTLLRAAVPGARVVAGDWHSRHPVGSNAHVAVTPANHWSRRGARDARMALWSGFLLETPVGRVWFAGDTGYGSGPLFRDIHARYGPPDVALIPIGAYEPRWFMRPQHINPAEAVQIFQDLRARQALGIHWGTFQLTDEAREAPVQALHAALAQANLDPARFPAAAPGDVFVTPGAPQIALPLQPLAP